MSDQLMIPNWLRCRFPEWFTGSGVI